MHQKTWDGYKIQWEWDCRTILVNASTTPSKSCHTGRCGTEMTHNAKKHMIDYCSACGVAHVVIQRALHHEYLHEKRAGAKGAAQ